MWSIPERLRDELLTVGRYTNLPLPFFTFFYTTYFSTVQQTCMVRGVLLKTRSPKSLIVGNKLINWKSKDSFHHGYATPSSRTLSVNSSVELRSLYAVTWLESNDKSVLYGNVKEASLNVRNSSGRSRSGIRHLSCEELKVSHFYTHTHTTSPHSSFNTSSFWLQVHNPYFPQILPTKPTDDGLT